MPYVTLPTQSIGDPTKASWANQVKDNFEAISDSIDSYIIPEKVPNIRFNANNTITVYPGRVLIKYSVDLYKYYYRAASYDVDITVVGRNGLDVGVPAINTGYYIYAIPPTDPVVGTSFDVVFSLVSPLSGGPGVSAGYWRYLGYCYYNAASRLNYGWRTDEHTRYDDDRQYLLLYTKGWTGLPSPGSLSGNNVITGGGGTTNLFPIYAQDLSVGLIFWVSGGGSFITDVHMIKDSDSPQPFTLPGYLRYAHTAYPENESASDFRYIISPVSASGSVTHYWSVGNSSVDPYLFNYSDYILGFEDTLIYDIRGIS